MTEIKSESKFLWTFVLDVLKTPFTLLMILFGKKKLSDLLDPFRNLFAFIFEPKFTIAIILINAAMFIAMFFMDQALVESLIEHPSDLINLRLHTLITSGFLHADISHLVGNMIGIFIFGRVVERKLGLRTGLVYFGALVISGLLSSTIHLMQGSNVGGLGASGALMGLIAAAILLDPFYLTYEAIIPIPVMVMGWLAIYADIAGVLSPVQDNIGHWAHIGGFVSMAVIMFILGIEERKKMMTGLWINIGSFVLAVIGLYFWKGNLVSVV